MEKQRNLDPAGAGSLHLAALSRQNLSDIARDLGSVDSVDGDHLFAAARAPISAVRTGAFVLGFASDLHDESLCRESRRRRADRAGNGGGGEIYLARPRPARLTSKNIRAPRR